MTSQTIRRVGSAAIERRRAKINAQIATLGLPLPGSLVERRTRCGNTGCHCHGDPPQLHGPYLIWTRKVDNKTVTRTLEARGLGLFFPSTVERFERLEEALQICRQMWSDNDGPFEGKHYRLDRTLNSPQALSRPHPPILIGGAGEKKTLRLVARYADACNIFDSLELAHKLDVLREHC